ncbi:60S ribosomal protein L27a [Myotis davidii]|uniref:60S ribosomal protein L27a n=1 Tax=Myotis davidii TaxID=225400 RepID=L5MHE7_MYODS|nr:60S ribosomal protein L27a [Myotis davidii]
MLATCIITGSTLTNITQVTGKVGMRHYHLKRNQSFCPTVNLDKLWTLWCPPASLPLSPFSWGDLELAWH